MDRALDRLNSLKSLASEHMAAVKAVSVAEQARDKVAMANAGERLEEISARLEQQAFALLSVSRPETAAGVAAVLAFAARSPGCDVLPDLTEDGRDYARELMAVCAEVIRLDVGWS